MKSKWLDVKTKRALAAWPRAPSRRLGSLWMRTLDRLLLNPYVQRLGGVQALVGGLALALGIVKGINPLIVVAGLLCLANLALFVFWPKVKRHLAAGADRPERAKNALSLEERRKALDDFVYPPADPRRELGERCRSFANRVSALIAEHDDDRATTIGHYMREGLEADPGLDQEEAKKQAVRIFERNIEAAFELLFRAEALELFDEARKNDAIAAKFRREIERPEGYALGEVPGFFRAIARRLGVAAPEPEHRKHKPLTKRIDDLHREGQALLIEVSAPVEPEVKDGTLTVYDEMPDEWWEKVREFEQGIRDLFMAEYPALLQDFARGAQEFVKEREEQADDDPDPEGDIRSNLEKWIAFVNDSRSGPSLRLEAMMEGLACARRRAALEIASSN
jgi:hypothetical protein